MCGGLLKLADNRLIQRAATADNFIFEIADDQ
jgi:hypothetical protein